MPKNAPKKGFNECLGSMIMAKQIWFFFLAKKKKSFYINKWNRNKIKLKNQSKEKIIRPSSTND